jgi:signal transduction histidine kinase
VVSSPAPAIPVRILVVDDHADNRTALRAMLSSPDYRIVEAASGGDALLRQDANEDRNLSDTQREWAATIHSAGRDLLALINQILDLSRIEAGRIETHLEPYPVQAVEEFAERTFRPPARSPAF